MTLEKTYPSLLTADLAAAEGWYTKLLGCGSSLMSTISPPSAAGSPG